MLTDRQRQVYDFISHYVEKYGYAPKLREIGEHLEINSRGTVHRHLRVLEQAGLIRNTLKIAMSAAGRSLFG